MSEICVVEGCGKTALSSRGKQYKTRGFYLCSTHGGRVQNRNLTGKEDDFLTQISTGFENQRSKNGEDSCKICQRIQSSMNGRCCSSCSHKKGRFKLNDEQLKQILTIQNCQSCGHKITHFRGGEGRLAHLDHDHECCPTTKSGGTTCGKCLRAVLCNHCNQLEGMLWTQLHIEVDRWTDLAQNYLEKYA